MPALPDVRRERFAQMVARGVPAIEAYVSVGFKRNTGNAITFKQRPDVSARINELRDQFGGVEQKELLAFLKESDYTQKFIVKELFDIANEAKKAHKFEAAAKILKELGGELYGMFVEKKNINAPSPADTHNSGLLTGPIPSIDFKNLNKAVAALGVAGFSGTQIDGESEEVNPARADVPQADKRGN